MTVLDAVVRRSLPLDSWSAELLHCAHLQDGNVAELRA
eukprot:CAMPEP_0180497318 /NCGR_PEP_ID=MMETSP1036_2-20121128/42735_1 /TAXON_ID=632150 /ORGANISM="Azadinium spinosum, Strain 3D9" /LENGTH=37 /DNA_ID= /DNA_START= /DNA_END= /DNA_ORIENTATION=